jgi:hypothetical protein
MDVTTAKVAEKLYSTLHELMHWHEGGLLGSAKPVDQLVMTNIGEPGDCIVVIPDTFIEVCLCTVCFGGALPGDNAHPFGKTYILKTLTHQVEQCWTVILLCIQKLSQNIWLEIGERECEELLRSKLSLVRHNVSCDILGSFLERDLDSIRLCQAFFNQLVWCAIGIQRSPARVTQLKWGVC